LETLDGRVRTLEERVHTLTVAPVIANSAEKTTSSNPVAQACADLARQLVNTPDESPIFSRPFSRSDPPTAEHIRSAMADLGCSPPRK
jgi:hypothetical protein